jgi:hypothetical protein
VLIRYVFLFSEEKVPQYEEQSFFEHFCVSREVVHSNADQHKTSEQYRQHFGQYGKLSASASLVHTVVMKTYYCT